jgi:hypothetical protein
VPVPAAPSTCTSDLPLLKGTGAERTRQQEKVIWNLGELN